jgi:glyoxylase-like metal-dependent hydrolase (beta-lactamase superfamily II)
MKLHFLGTGAADWDISKANASQDFRRHSSMLVDGCLLVDPGACIFEFESTYGYTDLYAGVTDIVCTHKHGDHYNPETVKKLEARGAVFLPAGGWRFGKEMTRVNEYGGYWTSTGTDNNSDDPQAFGFYFDGDDDGIYNNYTFPRRFCMTVRLVQDK